MMRVNAVKQNNDSDIVYYDSRQMGCVASGEVDAVQKPSNCIAIFNDQRQTSLLTNPADYYLSIIRFTIDSSSLPLFIMPVCTSVQYPIVGPNNLTITPYVITLEYGGFEFGSNVMWRPDDLTIQPPLVTTNVDFYQSEYFFVHTYQHFVNLINTAFKNAFTGLQALVALPSQFAPYMKYNRELRTFDIVVDGLSYKNVDFRGDDNPAAIHVYFNNYLYDMFFNVQSTHLSDNYGIIPNPDLKNHLLNFQVTSENVYEGNTANTIYYNPYGVGIKAYADTVLIMQVEWNINSNICENGEIVFTTSLIPVASQFISPYIKYDKDNRDSVINTFQRQLTDFAIPPAVDQSGATRGLLTYIPQVYRYLELNGTKSLSELNIYASWRTNRGTIIPLKLGTNSTITLKFLFVKKSSINPNN